MIVPTDGPTPLKPGEEARIWHDFILTRPPHDPLHRWARRRLIRAGVLADDPGEDGA